MEIRGKIEKVEVVNSETIRVGGDCSTFADSTGHVKRSFSIDVPVRFADAYRIGREVKLVVALVD